MTCRQVERSGYTYWTAGQRRLFPFAQVDACGDKNGSGCCAGMTAAFAALFR